ncbi:beta-N-acetylhexosaminidase, partial [Alkalibaculum bacchi]|uniref:beta-N-acetylhexosaminidase n=1 Tax=Alkalibaculum bacchi TaxID=645887 RepID=UPI0026EFBE2B
MRYFSLLFAVCFFSLNISASKLYERSYNKGINIVPKPLSVTLKDGYFLLTPETEICYFSPELHQVAKYLINKLSTSTGYSLETSDNILNPKGKSIVLSIEKLSSTNEEAYVLEVSSDRITLKGNTSKGVFYAIQTLLQLLPAEIESQKTIINEEWKITNVKIQDEPQFEWRGMMLDICRHFFGADFIKKQIDVLALYKINKLHLHLTNDQGWRIEIKKYPKLTEVGAWRTEFDGSVNGGFLTQEEIKNIVAYASSRQITIVPEIEMPGHVKAALASYPELSCTGGPFNVRTHWGIENDVMCPGKESTFEFVENVLEEIIPLFPSEYIHIGGDECPKVRWNVCPNCKKRIEKEDLKSINELQSYFVRRVEKIASRYGKKIIGWEEILDEGVSSNVAIMPWSWRGAERTAIEAARKNHKVIVASGNWLYLDYYQGDRKLEPAAIGGYSPLKKVYEFDPIPDSLSGVQQKNILGSQANLWTEYATSKDLAEYRIYPRILALAELTWTAKNMKNYEDFTQRIHNQLVRLDCHDVNYHIPQPEQPNRSCNKIAFLDSVKVSLNISRPLPIIYTLDGSEPTLYSPVYVKPLEFKETSVLKTRTLLPSGVMSRTRTIEIEKQNYAPSVNVMKVYSGLKGKKVLG